VADLGLNFLGGAEFVIDSPVRPFAELQFTPVFSDVETGTLFTLKGGVLFPL
jgi:hypothetical protein